MSSLLDQIIPGILAGRSNKKIDILYEKAKLKEVLPLSNSTEAKNALKQLKEDIEKQRDRKKGIEDKAKTIFTAISISVTAITFILNYNSLNVKTILSFVSLGFLLTSIICFIMASIRAMQTINIKAFHVFQVEMEELDSGILLKAIGNEEKQIINLAKVKFLNDIIILKISNYAWASFVLLRNGIILFASYFTIALFQKAKAPDLNTSTVTIVISDSSSRSFHTVFTTFQKDKDQNFVVSVDSAITNNRIGKSGINNIDSTHSIRRRDSSVNIRQ